MKDKLIVTDLDGTLLNATHEVSDFNYYWIKKFQENNGFFTFATGRMNQSVRQYITSLHIDFPVITYNGAQIYCPKKNKVIYKKRLIISKKFIDFMQDSMSFVEIAIFYDDQVFTLNKGRLVQEMEQKERIETQPITIEKIPKEITKIVFMSSDITKLKLIEQGVSKQFSNSEFVYSEPNYLEVLPIETSKGNALKEIKRRYSLQDLYTVSFGNNLNDISLLDEADIGIAVKNSNPELFNIADHVSTYTNNESIVGNYILKLFQATK